MGTASFLDISPASDSLGTSSGVVQAQSATHSDDPHTNTTQTHRSAGGSHRALEADPGGGGAVCVRTHLSQSVTVSASSWSTAGTSRRGSLS